MTDVTEYRIVSAIYTRTDSGELRDRLSKQVNELIAIGWQPHGSALSDVVQGALVVMQPMVKYQ